MTKMSYEYAPEIVKDGKAHLAAYTSNGFAIPLVQETKEHGGTPLYYVEDPSIQGGVFPMYIKSLSRREWVLRCACGKQGCTLQWVLKVRIKGRHELPDAVAEPGDT